MWHDVPTFVPTHPTGLENAELIAGFIRHLVGGPRRIEDDFDFDGGDAGEGSDDLLAVGDELRAGGAHGAGHGHVDLDVRLPFGREQIDGVDQAEVHDVDEQLGVDDLLELLTNEVFGELAGTSIRGRGNSSGISY